MILVRVLVLALILLCSEAYTSSCLSWRLAVETNNIRGWATVPPECLEYVKAYMEFPPGWNQYTLDVGLVVQNIIDYAVTVPKSNDGRLRAWILDVDDTCISNLPYYSKIKRYGGLPYDSTAFMAWALMAACPAIPSVLKLFQTLKGLGFKVILVTGRDDEKFRQATVQNLKRQGFCGYDSIILRNSTLYKGWNGITYKSTVRKRLEEEGGYTIVGNVGDQWSDLLGDHVGIRTFKIPNPMYFVP